MAHEDKAGTYFRHEGNHATPYRRPGILEGVQTGRDLAGRCNRPQAQGQRLVRIHDLLAHQEVQGPSQP